MDAPPTELDDRIDHTLLLSLEDALCASALDQELELLRADDVRIDVAHAEHAVDPGGDPGQQVHDRAEDPTEEVQRTSALRSVYARARVLGTSSPKMIVKKLSRAVTMTSASAPAYGSMSGMVWNQSLSWT